MSTSDTIIRDRQAAEGYDQQARNTNWFGPEVIFGLLYEVLSPGQKLLDLGIGSGLSSILFNQAGLRIWGLDGSAEILQVCATKGFTEQLQQHDLRDLPLPYPSSEFDYVLCVAVLNSFQDLQPLFTEIYRILKPGGFYAFTLEMQKPGQADHYLINRIEVDEKPKEESAVTLFRHSWQVIGSLLEQHHLILKKKLEFVAFSYPAENMDIYATAFITQK
jgi:ubiquinone/menaquinone biosynthesis C-methylase UbiE